MDREVTAALKDAYAKYGWKGFCQERLARAKKRAELFHYEPYYMALEYLRNGDKEWTVKCRSGATGPLNRHSRLYEVQYHS